jgi:integrase
MRGHSVDLPRRRMHVKAAVVEVDRQGGHASAAITLDVYADLFDDDLDAVGGSLDARRRDSLVAPMRPETPVSDFRPSP